MRAQLNSAAGRHNYAVMFAALGDETRLSIVSKLVKGQARSISELTEGTRLTRQAVTKHLRVLEDAGIVQNTRSGRESIFELDMQPFKDMEEYLEFVSTQWDKALAKLKAFVEE
jgi:DNA-binding transcriptional ArsR family regulator